MKCGPLFLECFGLCWNTLVGRHCQKPGTQKHAATRASMSIQPLCQYFLKHLKGRDSMFLWNAKFIYYFISPQCFVDLVSCHFVSFHLVSHRLPSFRLFPPHHCAAVLTFKGRHDSQVAGGMRMVQHDEISQKIVVQNQKNRDAHTGKIHEKQLETD